MERGEVLVDIVAAGQMGEGIIEQGTVFGQSEGFDVPEGLEQRGAESVGGTELCGQAGTELFVGEASGEDVDGFRGEAVFHVFQETLQDVALDMAEECGVGEESQGCRGHKFLVGFTRIYSDDWMEGQGRVSLERVFWFESSWPGEKRGAGPARCGREAVSWLARCEN